MAKAQVLRLAKVGVVLLCFAFILFTALDVEFGFFLDSQKYIAITPADNGQTVTAKEGAMITLQLPSTINSPWQLDGQSQLTAGPLVLTNTPYHNDDNVLFAKFTTSASGKVTLKATRKSCPVSDAFFNGCQKTFMVSVTVLANS